jgi:hypothetical protein
MGLYAMWIPGSAALGDIYTNEVGYTGGGSYASQPGLPGFVAASVPTPVIINNRRVRLAKVIILYRIGDGSVLKNVAVYDGTRLLKERAEWASGDFTAGLFPENVLEFEDKPEAQFGIQICLWFDSPTRTGGRIGPAMSFAGFGADFVDGADPV